MKEKVLRFNLPKGIEFLKVIKEEKTRFDIVDVEKCTYQQKEKARVEIPKPKALKGGSEVYQNDDVPYWYCNIKGRDAFMHVYMEDLTEEDLLYDSKMGRKREFSTYKQKQFKKNVLEALKNKPKEGFRWIPVYEPSRSVDGSVQFVVGKEPLVGVSSLLEWDNILENYSPKNKSGKSSKTTYFLLLLRWLKDGLATLEQLIDHSEEIGHYIDSKNAKDHLEKTGERKFGGIYGFVGNTCKIVEDSNSKSGYSIVGGGFFLFGNRATLSDIHHIEDSVLFTKDNPYVVLLELKE